MRIILLAVLCCCLPASAAAQNLDPAQVEFFEKKVRPVLITQCYKCHSADAQKAGKLRGGLLLDSREGLLKGGENGPAIVPGKPKESLLIKAVRHDEIKMPPGARLPDGVVADLVKWVEMGAPDPRAGAVTVASKTIDIEAGKKYWAFQPIRPSAPPAVASGWARTSLDRFILDRLEEKKLSPNPIAGKEKLIRRATYDLWGLPPSPEEVEAFLKDTSPDAYEKLIDRLLASDRYGERWARHWLDLVRYAESGGYEFDKDRPGAHHYRDFVIKSFNQDMRYDQFVSLQLAGDLLQPGDFSAVSATGFLVAGPYPGQTTAKTIQLIRYDHLDDMLATIGSSMLGLSVGCARCHDHKFDPIPQKDYYSLLACLSRTDSTEAKLDPQAEVYKKAKAEFDQAHAPLLAARDRFEKEELPGRLQKWLADQKQKPTPAWLVLDPLTTPVKINVKDGKKATSTNTYTLTARTLHRGITRLRLEVPHEEGDAAKAEMKAQLTVTASPLADKA